MSLATGEKYEKYEKYERILVLFPSAQSIKSKSKYKFVRNRNHNPREKQILETKKNKDKERTSMKYISFAIYGVGYKRSL